MTSQDGIFTEKFHKPKLYSTQRALSWAGSVNSKSNLIIEIPDTCVHVIGWFQIFKLISDNTTCPALIHWLKSAIVALLLNLNI